MPVIVAIRKATDAEPSKVVAANQKAIDALPFDSGTWRVEGVPGLYLRCRAKTKSFFLQRRVRGVLVKETLGAQSMKRARAAAMSTWSGMKPQTAGDGVTLAAALELYLQDKQLAEKTRANYKYLRVPSSNPSVSLRLRDLHGPVIVLPYDQGVAQQFLNFLPLPQGQ